MSDQQLFSCPNCGAVLNNQGGFSPNVDTWICTNCGQFMRSEPVPSESIPSDFHQNEYDIPVRRNSHSATSMEKTNKMKRHSAYIFSLLLILVLCAGGYFFSQNKFIDLSEYKDNNYYNALTSLEEMGFSNIKLNTWTAKKSNKSENGTVVEIYFSHPDSFINTIFNKLSNRSESSPAKGFFNKDSEIQIIYIPFETKSKNGFTNNKLDILQHTVYSIPDYYTIIGNDSYNTIIYQPNDKNNKTLFEIQIDRSQEWSELETYEKPYIVSSRPYIIRDLNNSNIYPGQLTELLAKQNDQVYHIESFCFLLPTSNDTIHFTLVSPDNYSIDYFSDFKEVLNSISVNEKLIKVSFSLKELQGKRIDDVREQLKQAGFLSINEIPTSAVFRSQKEGTVAKVVVDRDKSLEDSDIYSIDSVVTITYYSK